MLSHGGGLSRYSVILFAPVPPLGPLLFTAPGSGRARLYRPLHGQDGEFLKLYFPVFVLARYLAKLIELSGFSRSIAASVIALSQPSGRSWPSSPSAPC